MEVLSDKEDSELKKEIKDRYSIHETAGVTYIADSEEAVKFYWPYDREEYKEIVGRTADFLNSLNFENLYAVAFKEEQYIDFEENFEEKYDNKSVKIAPKELNEVSEDLIEFMVVPESKDWIIVLDHEGDIAFNGDKAFIREVKDYFDDWEELSEVPERRNR